MEFGETPRTTRHDRDFGIESDQLIDAIIRGEAFRAGLADRRFQREQSDSELRSHGERERLVDRVVDEGRI